LRGKRRKKENIFTCKVT